MNKPTIQQAMQMARGSWPTEWDVDPADALVVLAERVRELEKAPTHPLEDAVRNTVEIYEQRPFNVAQPLTSAQEIENDAILMAHALAAWSVRPVRPVFNHLAFERATGHAAEPQVPNGEQLNISGRRKP